MKRSTSAAVALILGLGMSSGLANASTITFTTPANSSLAGLPVSAQATFTTSDNTLSIVLQNTQANPTGIIQSISDLAFTLSTGFTRQSSVM